LEPSAHAHCGSASGPQRHRQSLYGLLHCAVAIVFFGGMLYDKLGPRRSSLLFCLLVLVGATIVALAQSRWQLFAGRLISCRIGSAGRGAEWIVSRWFKGRELALAFGIISPSAVSELFSALTRKNLSPVITEATGSHFGGGRLLPVLSALQSGL